MNSALRRRCDAIRSLLAAANADEARTRHKVGTMILEVRDAENKYGSRAVVELASELGRQQSTLYRYARVAECWSVAALDALLRRHTPCGDPLSWSHLVEISVMKSAAARARVVERAIKEGLSVREVAHRAHGGGDSDQPHSAIEELRRFVSITDSLRGRAHWDLEGAALDESQETLALLERAVSAQKELQDLCARNLSRLREAREHLAGQLAKTRPPQPVAPRPTDSGRLIAGYRSAS